MWSKSELRGFGACIATVFIAFVGLVYVLTGFVAYFVLGMAASLVLLLALRPETLTIPYEYWRRVRNRE